MPPQDNKVFEPVNSQDVATSSSGEATENTSGAQAGESMRREASNGEELTPSDNHRDLVHHETSAEEIFEQSLNFERSAETHCWLAGGHRNGESLYPSIDRVNQVEHDLAQRGTKEEAARESKEEEKEEIADADGSDMYAAVTEDADLVAMKRAAAYGCVPAAIVERTAPDSYGVAYAQATMEPEAAAVLGSTARPASDAFAPTEDADLVNMKRAAAYGWESPDASDSYFQNPEPTPWPGEDLDAFYSRTRIYWDARVQNQRDGLSTRSVRERAMEQAHRRLREGLPANEEATVVAITEDNVRHSDLSSRSAVQAELIGQDYTRSIDIPMGRVSSAASASAATCCCTDSACGDPNCSGYATTVNDDAVDAREALDAANFAEVIDSAPIGTNGVFDNAPIGTKFAEEATVLEDDSSTPWLDQKPPAIESRDRYQDSCDAAATVQEPEAQESIGYVVADQATLASRTTLAEAAMERAPALGEVVGIQEYFHPLESVEGDAEAELVGTQTDPVGYGVAVASAEPLSEPTDEIHSLSLERNGASATAAQGNEILNQSRANEAHAVATLATETNIQHSVREATTTEETAAHGAVVGIQEYFHPSENVGGDAEAELVGTEADPGGYTYGVAVASAEPLSGPPTDETSTLTNESSATQALGSERLNEAHSNEAHAVATLASTETNTHHVVGETTTTEETAALGEVVGIQEYFHPLENAGGDAEAELVGTETEPSSYSYGVAVASAEPVPEGADGAHAVAVEANDRVHAAQVHAVGALSTEAHAVATPSPDTLTAAAASAEAHTLHAVAEATVDHRLAVGEVTAIAETMGESLPEIRQGATVIVEPGYSSPTPASRMPSKTPESGATESGISTNPFDADCGVSTNPFNPFDERVESGVSRNSFNPFDDQDGPTPRAGNADNEPWMRHPSFALKGMPPPVAMPPPSEPAVPCDANAAVVDREVSTESFPDLLRQPPPARQPFGASETSNNSATVSSSNSSSQRICIQSIHENITRGTNNVMEVLFGDTRLPSRGRERVNTTDIAQTVLTRTLLPWSVIYSPPTNMWVATLQTNQKALDSNNVDSASKSLRAFSLPTEKQAKCLARAWTPPRMLPFSSNPVCHICNAKFAVFRRACHCRNCGVCVCKDCTVLWPAKMLIDTFNLKRESSVNICKSCDWLCNSFRLALLEGNLDQAVALHASGNINLHTPFANVKGELFYPVHCAVLGGNLQLLQWLVDDHCCPIKSVRVSGKTRESGSKYTPIVTSKGRSLLGIAMENTNVPIVHYLVVKKGILLAGERDITPEMLIRNLDAVLRLLPASGAEHSGLPPSNAERDVTDDIAVAMEESAREARDAVDATTSIIDLSASNGRSLSDEARAFGAVYAAHRSADLDEEGASEVGGQGEDECIICFDNRIDCVATPCGHAICCLDCSSHINRCPVCAQACGFMRIFKP